jgi:hypothetical protein
MIPVPQHRLARLSKPLQLADSWWHRRPRASALPAPVVTAGQAFGLPPRQPVAAGLPTLRNQLARLPRELPRCCLRLVDALLADTNWPAPMPPAGPRTYVHSQGKDAPAPAHRDAVRRTRDDDCRCSWAVLSPGSSIRCRMKAQPTSFFPTSPSAAPTHAASEPVFDLAPGTL